MTKDAITAHHEAAHGVVLYRTAGHVGGHLSIVRRHDVLGSATDAWSDSFNAEHMEATILSCYAGGHAQRIVDPSCGEDGCDIDDAIALEQLRLHGWEHREQELRSRSRELTLHHWPEIEAVAAELLRVKVLSDTEVEILADAAAGDPEADIAAYRQYFGPELEAWRERVISDGWRETI